MNDYIKQLEEQNEQLKATLADAQEEVIKSKGYWTDCHIEIPHKKRILIAHYKVAGYRLAYIYKSTEEDRLGYLICVMSKYYDPMFGLNDAKITAVNLLNETLMCTDGQ